ncbi:NAD(P)H-dependent oxidoreductase [Acidobacteriota bacterium]
MKRILLLVGSPRGKKSASTLMGRYILDRLEEKGMETEMLWLIRHFSTEQKMAEVIESISRADIVVLTAPLYDDCQPFIVAKMMEAVSSNGVSMEGKLFLPIINSGFGEVVHITSVSISMYKMFAQRVGFEWAGSLAVGGGEMLRAREGKRIEDLGFLGKKLKASLEEIADTLSGDHGALDARFEFPRIFLSRFFMRLGNRMWAAGAKKNGAAVDAKPYAP